MHILLRWALCSNMDEVAMQKAGPSFITTQIWTWKLIVILKDNSIRSIYSCIIFMGTSAVEEFVHVAP